jgi:D-3-phosphoglycerate dehydrogenase
MERVRPYARVADRLASFSVQWLRGLRDDVELAIEGDATKLDTEFIALGALRGFLSHVMEGQVTYVNAPILAKEKGIRITQVKRHGDTHYRSALVMTARGDSSLVVGGTVSLQGDARLVRVNDYHLDFPLAGRFVVIEHQDQPGAVGRVGTVLGNSKISTEGQTAMMIITVDSPVPDRVLDNLRELADISNVMSIQIEA